jgi:hypothetical protein
MEDIMSLRTDSARLLEVSEELRHAALAGEWTRVADLEAARTPTLMAVCAALARSGEALDTDILAEVRDRLQAVLASDRVAAEAVKSGRRKVQDELLALGRGARGARRYELSLASSRD